MVGAPHWRFVYFATVSEMSKLAVAALIALAVIAAVLAVPRMHDSAIGKYVEGKCDATPQPPECFPQPHHIPSVTASPGWAVSNCHC